MAQSDSSHMNVGGGLAAADSRNQSEGNCDENQTSQQHQQPQPNVRHIPIFVEGRDEPLINKNVQRSPVDAPGAMRQPSPTVNDLPKSGSIYSRVKDIPVRSAMGRSPGRTGSPSRTIPINVTHAAQKDGLASSPSHSFDQQRTFNQKFAEYEQPNLNRSNSRVHSVPIKVEHNPEKDATQAKQPPAFQRPPSRDQSAQFHQHTADEVDFVQAPKPNPAVQQSLDAITKIQKIQQDVLALMNRVEQYQGGPRTDKEYLYLDEMLTQNLLKLDTIDAEGKDNIKAARKEAIKCINKCIAVLEARTDLGPSNSASNQFASVAEKQQDQSSQGQQKALKS